MKILLTLLTLISTILAVYYSTITDTKKVQPKITYDCDIVPSIVAEEVVPSIVTEEVVPSIVTEEVVTKEDAD